MIKTKKITKTVQETQISDVICNNCGNSCSNTTGKKDNNFGYEGLVEAQVHGGYMSKVIGDMTSWKFSICEKCLSKIVSKFKIAPAIKGDYSYEFVSSEQYLKLEKKALEKNRKDLISHILKMRHNKHTKKQLSQMADETLHTIHHNLHSIRLSPK